MTQQQFEYKVISVHNVPMLGKGIEADIENQLNELGRAGWDLVGMQCNPQSNGVMFCLKRPMSA